ncbi:MAG: hypothetical protein QM764_08030 [Chitinophagaceae bacterium]
MPVNDSEFFLQGNQYEISERNTDDEGDSVVIDVASRYKIKADGSTDNTKQLMEMREDLAGTGKPKYILNFPRGELQYSNNRFLFGIERFVVNGNLTVFRSIFRGNDTVLSRPFNSGPLWSDNTLAYNGTHKYASSYLIESVQSCEHIITCSQKEDASNFIKGNRILIWGYDQVGNGYPPGTRYNEWNEVESVNTSTGSITLKYPLKNSYDEKWWDVPNILGPGNNSGKPRITLLDRHDYKYCRYAEFNDLTFGNCTGRNIGSGLLQYSADTFVVNRCRVEGFFWPTESRIVSITDTDHVAIGGAAAAAEFDKILGSVTIIRSNFKQSPNNGGGADTIKLVGCFCAESTRLNPRNLLLEKCHLRSDSDPDVYTAALSTYPAQVPVRKITLNQLTFSSGSMAKVNHHINPAPYNSFKITHVSSNDIVIPFLGYDDAAFSKLRTIEGGVTKLFKDDGTKGGLVTDIKFEKKQNGDRGAFIISGNWKSAPSPGETWVWCYVNEIIDFGGHKVLDEKKLWSPQSARWAGNTQTGVVKEMIVNHDDIDFKTTNSFLIDLYGKVIDMELTVNKAYSGIGTAVLDMKRDNSLDIGYINLTQTGRRTMDASKAYGAKSGDRLAYNMCTGWTKALQLRVWTNPGFRTIANTSPSALPEVEVRVRWSPFTE